MPDGAWSSLPLPVTLNRFFALLDVFVFGISVSLDSCGFRRRQHHRHVSPVEQRLRFHHPDLLDVLREPHQQIAAALGM
jgi:hypothetical protein